MPRFVSTAFAIFALVGLPNTAGAEDGGLRLAFTAGGGVGALSCFCSPGGRDVVGGGPQLGVGIVSPGEYLRWGVGVDLASVLGKERGAGNQIAVWTGLRGHVGLDWKRLVLTLGVAPGVLGNGAERYGTRFQVGIAADLTLGIRCTEHWALLVRPMLTALDAQVLLHAGVMGEYLW